jgi:phosphoribosylglycinamide formyltransferase-1
MARAFISEPLDPDAGTFDPARMAMGEPGLPAKFRWRDRELVVAELLEQWKEHGDCKHGSGERYLRKHGYRLRTADGLVIRIYFQRSFGRSSGRVISRWWLHSIENEPASRPASSGA